MSPDEARIHLLLDEVASAHRARADEVTSLKVNNLLLQHEVSDLKGRIAELEELGDRDEKPPAQDLAD